MTITDQAATFGWMWLAACIIAAPLITYAFGRATVRLLGPATAIVWAGVVGGLVYVVALTGHHDLPGLVALFALATGLYGDVITPQLGRWARSLGGALVRRGKRG